MLCVVCCFNPIGHTVKNLSAAHSKACMALVADRCACYSLVPGLGMSACVVRLLGLGCVVCVEGGGGA